MPMKVFDATVSTFDGVFEKFRSEAPNNKANLILFLADKDPSTDLSWCPDCVRAEPVIYKKLESSSDDVALLRAYVGDRPTWRNSQHPWRVDSAFKLTGVPTLARWEDGTIKGRLEDNEAHLEHKIDTILKPAGLFTAPLQPMGNLMLRERRSFNFCGVLMNEAESDVEGEADLQFLRSTHERLTVVQKIRLMERRKEEAEACDDEAGRTNFSDLGDDDGAGLPLKSLHFPKMDALALRDAIKQNRSCQNKGRCNWIDIAASLGTNRTPFQCLARFQRSLNASILKSEWTEDEDDRLRTAVETYGESNWQDVASGMGGRTGNFCRQTYLVQMGWLLMH